MKMKIPTHFRFDAFCIGDWYIVFSSFFGLSQTPLFVFVEQLDCVFGMDLETPTKFITFFPCPIMLWVVQHNRQCFPSFGRKRRTLQVVFFTKHEKILRIVRNGLCCNPCDRNPGSVHDDLVDGVGSYVSFFKNETNWSIVEKKKKVIHHTYSSKGSSLWIIPSAWIRPDKNGNFIREFGSIKEAQETLGIVNVSSVCRGISSHTKGYFFKYKEEK
jgi:hypothetical protein